MMISMLGVMTASAGVVNFAKYSPTAGASKTITVSITATASSIAIKSVTCGGVFSGSKATGWKDSDTGLNKRITATAKINVKVSSTAKPNDIGTITVSYEIGKDDASETKGTESKQYKVVAKSTSTPKPAANSQPKAAAAPTEWDIAEQSVTKIQSEGDISIDIKEDPMVPANVLGALREKKCTLTLNFGSYTCTIDGKSLGALGDNQKPIDLSMKMQRDDKFSDAVGGGDAYQLHFAHKGPFPGKFTYSFKAEGSSPGDLLYLYYYYNQSGVVQGMQSAVVGDDGYVSFDIYHCSSYFVAKSPVEGAMGADFAIDAKYSQQLAEAKAASAELESQLTEANAALAAAEAAQPESAEPGQPEANPNTADPAMLGASAMAPIEKLFGVPYGALIAGMLGVAMLSVLLTMVFCRAGIFKKREKPRTDII